MNKYGGQLLKPLITIITNSRSKQVECLAALCHAYVEVLFGGQSAFASE